MLVLVLVLASRVRRQMEQVHMHMMVGTLGGPDEDAAPNVTKNKSAYCLAICRQIYADVSSRRGSW
jgi:hypothetical protein